MGSLASLVVPGVFSSFVPPVQIILFQFSGPNGRKFTVAVINSSTVIIVQTSKFMPLSFATKMHRVPTFRTKELRALPTFHFRHFHRTIVALWPWVQFQQFLRFSPSYFTRVHVVVKHSALVVVKHHFPTPCDFDLTRGKTQPPNTATVHALDLQRRPFLQIFLFLLSHVLVRRQTFDSFSSTVATVHFLNHSGGFVVFLRLQHPPASNHVGHHEPLFPSPSVLHDNGRGFFFRGPQPRSFQMNDHSSFSGPVHRLQFDGGGLSPFRVAGRRVFSPPFHACPKKVLDFYRTLFLFVAQYHS